MKKQLLAFALLFAWLSCDKAPIEGADDFELDPQYTAVVLTPEQMMPEFREDYPTNAIVESSSGLKVWFGTNRCVGDDKIRVLAPEGSQKSQLGNLTGLGVIKYIELHCKSQGSFNDANVAVGKVPFQMYQNLRAEVVDGVYRYTPRGDFSYFTLLNRAPSPCRYDRIVVYYEREAEKQLANPTRHSVMSFNLRMADAKRQETDGTNYWDYRKEASPRMINDLQPDVFGTQEELWTQTEYLMNELGDKYARVGQSRSTAQNDQRVSIYYRKDKFTLLAHGDFWLHEGNPLEVKLGWDSPYYRMVTWVKLQDASGKVWFHFNHHAVSTSEAPEAAKKGPVRILEQIKEIAGEDAAITFSADFNSNMMHSVSNSFLPFFRNSRVESPVSDDALTYHAFGTKNENNSQIDHIFYRGVKPLEYKTVTEHYGAAYISDHCPILFTFEL